MKGIRRATSARVKDAAKAIRKFEEENGSTLGPITKDHLEKYFARQPEGTEISVPQDNSGQGNRKGRRREESTE